MSIGTLANSLERGERLLPVLRLFLDKENKRLKGKSGKNQQAVLDDADMTIATFQERKEEYNHSRKMKGDFFHPSQLGRCLRETWFDYLDAPRLELKRDLLNEHMVFETGTYVGVVFQNLCQRAGVLVKREAPIVSAKLKMLGHADGVINPIKEHGVLETKTINSRGFSTTTAPKHAHVQQAHSYMKGLGLKWASIVYLEKDRHQAKEFVVPFSESFYQEHVRERIDNFFTCFHDKTPPDREGNSPDEPPCRWCPYARTCFGTSELKSFLKSLSPRKRIKLV